MSFLRLAYSGLRYHHRAHMNLLMGVALAAMIFTGARIVGDSVNQSLRDIAAARLGRITYAMRWTNRFFSQHLGRAFQNPSSPCQIEAVLSVAGTLALPPVQQRELRQLNQVHILGVAESFWRFAPDTTACSFSLKPQEAALNLKTAQALGVKVGDTLSLRFPKPGLMPQDAPLAAQDNEVTTSRLITVRAILGDEQLGRFSLTANQLTPCNVFVDRTWLQEQTGLADQANLLLTDAVHELLPFSNTGQEDKTWQLEDVGFRLRSHSSGVVQLESDRIFLEEEVVRAAREIPGATFSLTYLVDSISAGAETIPYSFVEAGDFVPETMPDGEVVINQWVADRLHVKPGDSLSVNYRKLLASNTFAQETRTFNVHQILPMDTVRMARELAPRFPGLTDVDTCADWSIGLPMEDKALKDPGNEGYWKQYGQTPKLFTPFKAGQAMWGTRFGDVMAVRFPHSSLSETQIRDRLQETISLPKLGLQFAPVKQLAQDAVNQATDLGGLFIGMSFFLIFSALILIGLLYSFIIQQRAPELGILLALGFPVSRVRSLLFLETIPTALLGAGLGSGLGIIYAFLLMASLTHFWSGAIANTTIRFVLSPTILVSSSLFCFIFALLIVFGAIRRGTRRTPVALMYGEDTKSIVQIIPHKKRPLPVFSLFLFLCAWLLVAYTMWKHPDRMVEPFFGAATICLMAGHGFYAYLLDRLAIHHSFQHPTLWKIALTNLARRRGRSLSVAVLTALGSFLILAVSSMQENVVRQAARPDSGTGGFGVFAETTVPMRGTPYEIQNKFGVETFPLRIHDGDDASCLNLNRAQRPRVIGVSPQSFIQRNAFAKHPECAALWNLLHAELPDGSIPALAGDTDTALWGLKKKADPVYGDVIRYQDEAGREVKLKLVGSLPMRLSVFQGSVLIADTAFTRLFPSEAGYRMFLLEAPPSYANQLNITQERLGMTAVSSIDRLLEFYAMESAYLGMFLVLGGLGLLLGIGGACLVVSRNLYERRGELALLEAVGFAPSTRRGLVMVEQTTLVLAGTLLGTLSASVAIIPLLCTSQSTTSSLALVVFLTAVLFTTLGGVGYVVIRGMRRITVADLRTE